MIHDGVDSVNKKTKGGLDKAAANQRKSIDDIIGANEIYDSFNQLREELNE